jgi:hypothetical protein
MLFLNMVCLTVALAFIILVLASGPNLSSFAWRRDEVWRRRDEGGRLQYKDDVIRVAIPCPVRRGAGTPPHSAP